MATERLGEELGRHLHKGQVLALVGEIGAGKTTLVRGLARGLLVEEPSEVASPTYLLVVEHGGPRPLLHADAYLPQKLQGFLDDGGLEYLFRRDAVAVVEWADRIADLVPKEALWLELGPDAAGGRTCKFRCADAEDFPWLPGLGHNLRAR
ncbi:MAG: tRNA (adenosine(37)-N6)-threonylcarbamoyltransferase complex ATPase subunit type 1 TsaE [Planctomycetota bacterium]